MADSCSAGAEGDGFEEIDQDLTDSRVFVLLELHEFICRILRSLPMKTLNTCAQVCRKWNQLSKKEKLQREKPMWLFYDHSNGNPSKSLEEPILKSRIEPQTAIAFLSLRLHENKLRVPAQSVAVTSRHPRAAKHEKKDFMDYLGRLLPKSCRTLGVITDGIVGMDGNVPREMESTHAASVLVLPKFHDFHIVPFELVGSQAEDILYSPFESKKEILELLKVPEGLTPRVVFTFGSDSMFDYHALLEKQILYHFEGKAVVAGGFADNLVPEEVRGEGMEETLMTGLTFCSSRMQMAAAILDHDVQTLETAQAEISKLKATNICTESAFAFMFSCLGRGVHHYHAEAIETKAFRKVFPNIPIFGFFGNGEVGHKYLPDYSKSDHEDYSVIDFSDDDSEDRYPALRHSYTTVIVVISLGNS